MGVIDLNADLGEGIGDDEAMLDIVSSASIACGGHAGDEATMRKALLLAHKRGVACGAHPGFADRKNFGRLRLDLSEAELIAQLEAQYEPFFRIAREESVPVRYVKLHGALANMAAEDAGLGRIAFAAAARYQPDIAALALDNSAQVTAAEDLGLRVIREAYADRAYTEEGLLVPRGTPGAVLTDCDAICRQCIQLASAGSLTALNGKVFWSKATSICIHGDTPDAVAIARAVRSALEGVGNSISHQQALF